MGDLNVHDGANDVTWNCLKVKSVVILIFMKAASACFNLAALLLIVFLCACHIFFQLL